ncbi:protein CBFA2T3 [Egretta garzetta]|uniref:protein CBFA2T3 n=1 Tax=Egretta garzetta TaxID=188379 RepID=UPI00163C92C7|nr:protein CBFA2T3 [Egretta garzetta]
MPDSPADVKTQPRSTPPSMPPPPPAVTQGATRHPSFTPNTMMNGSSHSPTAINGAPSTPNGFSNGPATSSTASLSTHQLPPACGARQLSKLKRFLTTLQQFGNDISPEIGERVRTLVLGLVNSTLTIEEFHAKLQEATNFPLRPFVIPFLKVGAPAQAPRGRWALAEAKRQASEDALTVINQQEDSSESCWNCGRKASETCSGCNIARYCGSFCQHKDWERHHRICGQGLHGQSKPLALPTGRSPPSD